MSYSRLWIGLVPLALLWGFASSWETPNFEKDIRARALDQARAAFPDAKAEVSGRDVVLSGLSGAEGAPQKVVAQVEGLAGVRILQAKIEELRVAKPFVFLAERLPGRVLLEGVAPTRADTARLSEVARAAQPGIEVVDRTELAAGQPKDFLAIAEHGVDLVSRLARGRFVLKDAAYSMQGDAADAASRKNALKALQRLPASATQDQIHIRPPLASPFLWSARQQGGGVVLRGFAPSEAAKTRVAAKAATAIDEMEIARGLAEDVFEKMAGAALSALGHLKDGRAEFAGSRLSLAGVSRGDLSVEEIGEQVRRALPDAVALDVAALRPLRAAPFVLTVTRKPEALSLAGFAPDAPAREAALASARNATPAVEGRLKIAIGQPEGLDYKAAAGFAIAQAMKLSSGVVRLSGGELEIEGEAPAAARAEIDAALKGGLPPGLVAGRANLRPPEEKGSVAVAALPLAPAAPAAPVVIASPIESAPQVAPAVPQTPGGSDVSARPRALSAAAHSAQPVPQTPGGSDVSARPRTLSAAAHSAQPVPQTPGRSDVSARPRAPSAAAHSAQSVSQPAPPIVVTPRQPHVSAAARHTPVRQRRHRSLARPRVTCAAGADGLLLQSHIFFDNARGLPREDQAETLLEIFAVAKSCGPVEVDVAGHTDQVGSREANLVLSQIRVAVVIRLLREAGVPMARVREAALGETLPVIPHESSERDRAYNRRVTVTIRSVRR